MKLLALTIPQGGGSVKINPPKGIPNGGISVVVKVIGNSLTILLIIATVLSLLFLIVGGLQWINSGGDKQKVASARNRITYAIVGLIIALGSFLIINVIGFFFSTNLLHIGN